MKNFNVDVLIVGSGGAGLSAAIEAHDNGANVLVLSKTYPTHSQTCQAQGGINASITGKKESIKNHIMDTRKGAHGLYDTKAIDIMCKEAGNTIKWLDELGVPFTRDKNNNIAQRKFGAATEIRTCFSSDYTGLKILHTLYDQCIKKEIPFLNEYQLLNIIHKNGKAKGITALNIHTSEVIEVFSKTTIIATGGYSNIYHKTTNSHSTTGDGIIAAFKAGCQLSNMEMIQFHPTAMQGNNILISESARGEGGYLIDENEERFIDELKPRDEVARAIYKKIKSGNQVYLDLRHIDKDKIIEFMPQEYRLAKEFYNIELDKDCLPINPAAHYSMGGVKTNVSCETNIENLYAVGECAQNGLHGANRLGGNSLQEIITFGRICGKNAAEKSKNETLKTKINSEQLLEDKKYIDFIYSKKETTNFYKIKKEIGQLMFEKVGLFRNENEMLEMQEKLNKISINQFGINDKNRIYNKNLIEYLEFINLITLSSIVTSCALKRKESRGAHYRSDYKNESTSTIQNTLTAWDDGKLKISFEEIA